MNGQPTSTTQQDPGQQASMSSPNLQGDAVANIAAASPTEQPAQTLGEVVTQMTQPTVQQPVEQQQPAAQQMQQPVTQQAQQPVTQQPQAQQIQQPAQIPAPFGSGGVTSGFVQQQPAAFVAPGMTTQPQAFAAPAVHTQQAPAVHTSSAGDDDDLVSAVDDVALSELERYPKLAAGQITRNFFAVVDERGSAQFRKAATFMIQIQEPGKPKPMSFFFKAPKDPKILDACLKACGEPKVRFGTIIGRYDTDMMGRLVPNASYKLFAYTVGKTQWPELQNIDRQWGLGKHDINLTCTEAEYQKTSIMVTPERVISSAPVWENEALTKARQLFDTYLPRLIGQIRPDEQILMLLRGQIPPMQGVIAAAGSGMAQGGAMMGGGFGGGQMAPAQQPYNPFNPAGQAQQMQPLAPPTVAATPAGTTDFSGLLATATQNQPV